MLTQVTLHKTYHVIMHVCLVHGFYRFLQLFRFLDKTNAVVDVSFHSLIDSFGVADLKWNPRDDDGWVWKTKHNSYIRIRAL